MRDRIGIRLKLKLTKKFYVTITAVIGLVLLFYLVKLYNKVDKNLPISEHYTFSTDIPYTDFWLTNLNGERIDNLDNLRPGKYHLHVKKSTGELIKIPVNITDKKLKVPIDLEPQVQK